MHDNRQGRNHVFKVGGSNFLVWGITALLQKKSRKVYPVWRRLLSPVPHQTPPKSYVKSWGIRQNIFGVSGPPRVAPVVAPMITYGVGRGNRAIFACMGYAECPVENC